VSARGARAAGALLFFALLPRAPAAATPWEAVRARMETDRAEGRVLVAHAIVPLCDNEHQGIVPVPAALGDGSDPARNLYWGATFGLRSFLTRQAGWTLLRSEESPRAGVLERVVLYREVQRPDGAVPCILVAEAWDGTLMPEAVERFLLLASGGGPETVEVRGPAGTLRAEAGGRSHLVVFVGHDGLMDSPLEREPVPETGAPARSAVALTCASRTFFGAPLEAAGAHRLLLTTGFMAPEAYTLAALLEGFFAGEAPPAVRGRAAAAYNRYQKCGARGAQLLFVGDP